MNISYKSWKTYLTCPKRYYLQYLKKEKPVMKEDLYHTVYGVITQKFFELFCNIWRSKTPYMPLDMIKEKVDSISPDILNICDWPNSRKFNQEEVVNQAYTDICSIMDSHNQNYFLNTKSEQTIKLNLKENITLEGRLDFIHFMPVSNEVVVFDGKGTNKVNKVMDVDQLFFYALLYYFQYKTVPIQLGFFYYRFNSFSPVIIDKDILNSFRARLSLDIKAMTTANKFEASPSSSTCKFCLYQNICSEYLQDKATRAKPSILDIEGDEIILGVDDLKERPKKNG